MEARYSFPLFWLAGFDVEDLVNVDETDDGESRREYPVLFARVDKFTRNLEQRKSGILNLIGSHFADFYDEWMTFIRDRYPDYVLLRTGSILSLDEDELQRERLVQCLKALERCNVGEPLERVSAFHWFSTVPDFTTRSHGANGEAAAIGWRVELSGTSYDWDKEEELWPLQPTAEEIAIADQTPEAPAPVVPPVRRSRWAHLDRWMHPFQIACVVLVKGSAGLFLLALGVAFLWGAAQMGFEWKGVAISVGLILFGGYLARSAVRSIKRRSIFG